MPSTHDVPHPHTSLPYPLALAAASFREQQERGSVTDLPAGASSVPLHLSAGLPDHTISFRCVPPPRYAAAAAADSLPLWSRPVAVREGVETQLHVVVPVIPPEEEQQGGESGDAAHLSASAAAAATRGMAVARGGAAAAAAGAGWPTAVAILRLSVHLRGAGALHVVLESMHSEPPYLLENRTGFPLQYRQVCRVAAAGKLPQGSAQGVLLPAGCMPASAACCQALPRQPAAVLCDLLQAHVAAAPYHALAPYSAVGYVWEYSVVGAAQELELQESGATGAGQRYALDAAEEAGDEGAAPARMQPLPLSVAPSQCSVRVAYWEQVGCGLVLFGCVLAWKRGSKPTVGSQFFCSCRRVQQLAELCRVGACRSRWARLASCPSPARAAACWVGAGSTE